MTAGWGLEGWGVDEWASVPSTMSMVYAYASSERSVLVVTSAPPQARSGFLAGDALNPSTWSVTVPLTGQVLRVIGSRLVDAQSVEVRLLDVLPGSFETCDVSAPTLLSAFGAAITGTSHVAFLGVSARSTSEPGQDDDRRLAGRDLKNLPTPSLSEQVSGPLQISGGDYVLESGPALVKKLIIRRLLSTPGDFFHIPGYGVGLRVKEPLPAGNMIKLQAEIRRQMLLEPEIESCSVRLTQNSNALTVVVSATLAATGQRVDSTIQVPFKSLSV